MKKETIAVLVFVFCVMATGCRQREDVQTVTPTVTVTIEPSISITEQEVTQETDYFAPLFAEEPECEEVERDEGLQRSYKKTIEESDAMTYKEKNSYGTEGDFVYEFLWIKLDENRIYEAISIDLSKYWAGKENIGWQLGLGDVFYDENSNNLFALFYANAHSSGYTGGRELAEEVVLLMAEIPLDSPEDYTITAYGGAELLDAGLWFGDQYRVGDTIYMNIGNPNKMLWSIDIKTKEVQ